MAGRIAERRTDLLGISRRWLAEEASVLAARLRRACVAYVEAYLGFVVYAHSIDTAMSAAPLRVTRSD